MKCPKRNCDGELEDRAFQGTTICKKCKAIYTVKALKGWFQKEWSKSCIVGGKKE